MRAAMRKTTGLSSLILITTTALGCGGDFGGDPSYGAPGVTPGGAQDIGYARTIIDGGGVPRAADFTAEGLLSEHDIAPVGPPCDSLLCLRPALGVAPSLATGQSEHWIHIGMSTGVADLARPPLDVVAVIDKSQSMSIDMEETTEAVARMIDHLGEDDRLAVIAFDDALHTVHALGPVTDKAALQAEVRAIRAGGGADLERGTRRGYEILREAGQSPERLRRVMVFSCGYPTLQPGGDDAYSQMVRAGGAERIGMSFFGVLLGYNSVLADLLGETRGGAYYYLQDLQRVEQVFDEEFDLMVTPVAYDLSISLELAPGFALGEVYGVPGEGGATSAEIAVSTVFFSKRRGALLARIEATGEAGEAATEDMGSIRLTYAPESTLGVAVPEGEVIEQAFDIRQPAAPDEYDSPGVRKAAALINMIDRMATACDHYHAGDAAQARAVLNGLIIYLEGEAEALGDGGLHAEVELLRTLRANMA